jgi:hypothetical protein
MRELNWNLLKSQRGANIDPNIKTSPCINEHCGIMTNYSGEGDCYWCNMQANHMFHIEHLKEQIARLEEAKRIIKFTQEEEE